PNAKNKAGEDVLQKLSHPQNTYSRQVDHLLANAKTLAPARRAPFELMQAAQHGDAAKVSQLAKGVSLGAGDVGQRALCNAAGQGHLEAVKALAAAGLAVKGKAGAACLARAADFFHWDVLAWLVEQGAPVTEVSKLQHGRNLVEAV